MAERECVTTRTGEHGVGVKWHYHRNYSQKTYFRWRRRPLNATERKCPGESLCVASIHVRININLKVLHTKPVAKMKSEKAIVATWHVNNATICLFPTCQNAWNCASFFVRLRKMIYVFLVSRDCVRFLAFGNLLWYKGISQRCWFVPINPDWTMGKRIIPIKFF